MCLWINTFSKQTVDCVENDGKRIPVPLFQERKERSRRKFPMRRKRALRGTELSADSVCTAVPAKRSTLVCASGSLNAGIQTESERKREKREMDTNVNMETRD
ncbi:hypothetical protein JZ751_008841 [Albula glossodonta]|uniref:Uncharacterized protein n=1 Tax=Albula glossodonta TaxID=121402 RepID=A0A8T2PAH2_9TELE|nr:hypothetical protein JZ751_008841 [Albula glossodonta]